MSNENNNESTLNEVLSQLPPETTKEISEFIQNKLNNTLGVPNPTPLKKQQKHTQKQPNEFDIVEHRREMSGDNKKRKKLATTQPITKHTEPNKFFTLGFDKLHKNDTKIDKKLIGDNQPTSRRPPPQYINVKCNRCGRICSILPNEAYVDDDGIQYVCDKCKGQ